MSTRGIGKGSDRKSVTDELSRGRPVLALLIAFPYRTNERDSGIFFFGLSNLPRSVGRSIDRQRGDNEQRRCTIDIAILRSPLQPRIICKHARLDDDRERNARFFHADGGR